MIFVNFIFFETAHILSAGKILPATKKPRPQARPNKKRSYLYIFYLLSSVPIISVTIANTDDPADFAARRPCGMDIGVRRSLAYGLNDLIKIRTGGNALAIRTNHIGCCDCAADCAGSGVWAGRHPRIAGWRWSGRGLAQPYHDAAGLFGKPKVDMRLGDLSI